MKSVLRRDSLFVLVLLIFEQYYNISDIPWTITVDCLYESLLSTSVLNLQTV